MSDKRRSADESQRRTATGSGDGGRVDETKRTDGGSFVGGGGYEISECIEMLANQRRRYVLYYLRREGQAPFEEITEQVAAWEVETSAALLDEQTKQNVGIDLHHAHLPKLEDAGFLWYDRLRGSVRSHYLPDPLETFLDYCSTNEAADTNW